MENLENLRRKIKKIDNRLLDLIAKRMEITRKIGRLKRETEIPLRDWSVEKSVIENAIRYAKKYGLDIDFTKAIITKIIEYSRIHQERLHYSIYSGKREDVLIIGGLGGMGRWFAYFFQNQGHRVAICDIKPEGLKGFKYYRNLESALKGKTIVLITTPLEIVPEIVEEVTELKTQAVVSDIASVKSHIIPVVEKALKNGIKITSIHPMFGPSCHTLNDKIIAVCDCGCKAANKKILALFKDTAVRIINLTFNEHDRLISYVLGLSHFINIFFVKSLMESRYEFKDLAKIASSTFNSQIETAKSVVKENPDLYFEIQRLNPYNKILYRNLKKSLQELIDMIRTRERVSFIKLFKKGSRWFDGDKD